MRQAVAATRLGGPPRDRLRPRPLTARLLIALGLLGRWSVPAAWQGLYGAAGPAEPPTDSALSQSRRRLGAAPLAYLARHVARSLAAPATHPGAFYKGLRLLGFDGATPSVPDTPANARAFGYAPNQHGGSGFPPLRLPALCELGTHALARWLTKPFAPSEVPRAGTSARHRGPAQLLLRDANSFSFRLWQAARGRGADLLARVQAGPLLTPRRRLGDGSYLARSYAAAADRLAGRGGVTVRVIGYTHGDPARVNAGKPHRLVTSRLEGQACPAQELVELYHSRWEQELAFDELKAHLNDRKGDVRSQRPAGVVQEVHGLLRAHGVLRALRSEAAGAAGAAPRALSFTGTSRVVLIRLPEAPRGPAADRAGWYAGLLAAIGPQRLRPRRGRINPRVLKGARPKYPRKARGQRGHRVKPFREHVLIL